MKSPIFVLPDSMKAMQALAASTEEHLSRKTAELVHLRASQVNGCGVCVDMHPKLMKRAGETDERILAVAAWRETPYFTDAERAALELTECLTRIADQRDPVPDEVWSECAKHYDEKGLAALVLTISAINVWNRVNVATQQIAGASGWNI
jgi:AhpD family alkylhydroperoxidase